MTLHKCSMPGGVLLRGRPRSSKERVDVDAGRRRTDEKDEDARFQPSAAADMSLKRARLSTRVRWCQAASEFLIRFR